MTNATELAEMLNGDCWAYARYMLPDFMFGDIHKDVLTRMGDEERLSDCPNLLTLIPRDHLKSVMLACYATWRVARNPAYTILYITADEDLGRLQMSFMQNIFESDRFKQVYPQHFAKAAGRRDKWTGLAINVDHPRRKELNIRDETIAVKTVKAGKCLATGTLVRMADGSYREVEAVMDGDKIIGPYGPVTATRPITGTSKMYRVSSNNAPDWVCNEDHILTLERDRVLGTYEKGTRHISTEVIDISVVDYMKLSDTAKKRHYQIVSGYDLPEKDYQLDPYTLGLWLGDGTSKAPEIHGIEHDVFNAMLEQYPLSTIHEGHSCPFIRIPEIRQPLKDIGVWKNKHIPDDYLIGSRTQRLELLAGLIDSDGYKAKGYWEVTQKSTQIAEGIKLLAQSLGFVVKQKSVRKKSQSGTEGTYIRTNISGEGVPCRLERKRIVRKRGLRSRINIHDIGVGDYAGFTVDGDGRFLLASGVVTHNTGRHPDEIMYDDLVVPENAYTEVGRREVRSGSAQAVSLAKTNSLMTAVGTTYHPADQYALWSEAEYDKYDDEGNYLGKQDLWKVISHQVENQGDGRGDFLWPKTYSPTLKNWYGWDTQSIAKKKAEYINNGEQASFYAQYYMEPNDPTSFRIKSDQFQYYNPGKVIYEKSSNTWAYNGKRLTIGCYLDVAVTDAASKNARKADYTALAVVGVDQDGYYYVLDLVQFQTDKRQVYYDEIITLYRKWKFRKVEIELENAGKLLSESLKDMVRKDGYNIRIVGKPAPRGISKHERHASITVPKYENGSVYHRTGGWTPELEEQIMKERPAHDDLLDVVTMALDDLRPPAVREDYTYSNVAVMRKHPKFGGRAR